jgi:epsilon-lactone hydrolase
MNRALAATAVAIAVAVAGVTTQSGTAPPKTAETPRAAAAAIDGNHSVVDADGTVRVMRVVPVPNTVSDEARKLLSRRVPDTDRHWSLDQEREAVGAWQTRAAEQARQLYPVKDVMSDTIGGVPVRVVTPREVPAANRDRVLLNLHGGGFRLDSGSFSETIPIANLTRMKVVAALYRLAPEHPFPAAVDDAVAVYKELLKTYRPEHIAIYGTSAGAILTGEVAVRLKRLNVPLPAALGVFSGFADFGRIGDSAALFGLNGLSGYLPNPGTHDTELTDYVRDVDVKDPLLSPAYADLKGLPPTLFITSGRDLLLSGTVNMHRAFLKAGVDARLVVFDALPHAFWNEAELPESREADAMMAAFFEKELLTRAQK